jgi:hypothetical protein
MRIVPSQMQLSKAFTLRRVYSVLIKDPTVQRLLHTVADFLRSKSVRLAMVRSGQVRLDPARLKVPKREIFDCVFFA